MTTIAIDNILGLSEVCERLGKSRQRVAVLRAEGRFPDPVKTLASGPLWSAEDIDTFAAIPRPAGRPT